MISQVRRTTFDANVRASTGALLWVSARQQGLLLPLIVDLSGRERGTEQALAAGHPRLDEMEAFTNEELETYRWSFDDPSFWPEEISLGIAGSPRLAQVLEVQRDGFGADQRYARNVVLHPFSDGLRGHKTLDLRQSKSL